MKKLSIGLVAMFMLGTYQAHAQYQHMFSDYDPAQTNQSMQQGNEGQQVYGYYQTRNGLKRIRLKVAQYSTYGVSTIYVIGYYLNDFGSGRWAQCRNMASAVSQYTDGTYIVNNFDYKCNVGGLGTVYF